VGHEFHLAHLTVLDYNPIKKTGIQGNFLVDNLIGLC
jgi:hypothetical protein